MKLCYSVFMLIADDIPHPKHDADLQGAHMVFHQFMNRYQPIFIRLEGYLDDMAQNAGRYAEAYKPWQQALHHLRRGVYLTAKKIPLQNAQTFIEAIQTFSFDGALRLLQDLCASCRISLPSGWAEQFRKHLKLLQFAFSIVLRQQQLSPQR
ncbi:MAG: hypothetical protein SFW63_08180 [Alphaproteobacteria bacterium]|nr:hypothetical protein [Alphaproteobacteria bacterium]